MRRNVVVAFWFLGLLNVECRVDSITADVECHLFTRAGNEVVCEQGGNEAATEHRMDLRPTTDVTCLAPLAKW